jgi:PTS system cellobiose-specific IIC component
MSAYDKMVTMIEDTVTPLAAKLGQQKYITSIRDGFIAALPFMMIAIGQKQICLLPAGQQTD